MKGWWWCAGAPLFAVRATMLANTRAVVVRVRTSQPHAAGCGMVTELALDVDGDEERRSLLQLLL